MRSRAAWMVTVVGLGSATMGCVAEPAPPEVGDAERVVIADGAFVAGAALVAAALAEAALGLGQLDFDSDEETAAALLSTHASETLPGCADVTAGELSVDVDLGADCELSTGSVATGQVEATVSGAPPVATIALGAVDVDGWQLEGWLYSSPTGEGLHDLTVDLTSGPQDLEGDLDGRLEAATVTLSGTLTALSGDVATSVSLTSVIYTSGDCYPGGGTLVISQPPVHLSVELDGDTARTGEVLVPVGRTFDMEILPPYGDCP